MNAILLRYVSREALGVMNVRLLLLYSSCQFMSREPFRRTVSRSQDVSLALLSLPVSVVYGVFFYYIWTKLLVIPTDFQEYDTACFFMVVSVVVEMLAEPFFILAQHEAVFFLRIFAEALLLIIRSMIVFLFVLGSYDLVGKNSILFAFGSGQVLGSIAYTTCFFIYFFPRLTELFSSLQVNISTIVINDF